ncbi:MAG: prepilin peptidase [Planctomycetota bacterium]|nr:prepilin peptidase [Planctomycetota bacterium]
MPDQLQTIQFAFQVLQVAFVFAFGACAGSLINVLVYRIPRGISVVTPPSRCPACQTKLTWRENIPVFGWLLLRGKCRFCKSRISPEYPIVEAFTGGLFAALYVLWFMIPERATWLGIAWGQVRPDWAENPVSLVWPTFVVVCALLGSLIAMALTDLKTYMIPLVLAWVPSVVGVIGHTAHAAWVQLFTGRQQSPGGLHHAAEGASWTIASPGPGGWWWVGAALGGMAGLVVSNILLATGLLRRSFADYDDWEAKARAAAGLPPATPFGVDPGAAASPTSSLDPASSPQAPAPTASNPNPDSTGPQAESTSESPSQEPAELWIAYPHARREMLKELAFLGPPVLLAYLGGTLAFNLAGPWTPVDLFTLGPAVSVPLWLDALAGALLGYLIGGGIVWGMRILGSLGFGKEAIGLGDVHLLAAVGACVGWIDAVLAFFAAAFVGLTIEVIRRASASEFRRAMQFGPALAIATLLVLVFKPLVEIGLSAIIAGERPVDLP